MTPAEGTATAEKKKPAPRGEEPARLGPYSSKLSKDQCLEMLMHLYLARYFDVPESLLGGPEEDTATAAMVPVGRSLVRASAGPGAIPNDERTKAYFAFDERWLRKLTGAVANDLTLIRVEGDSMSPTLADGDDILIDRSDAGERLRDGIYVLRIEDALMVKRLALHPITHRVTVQSDNPAYSDWPDCRIEDIHCIGRVIWAGRRVP